MKISTIGTGVIVERFLNSVSRIDGVNVYAVYSRSEDKALNLANAHGVKRTYTDIHSMFSDDAYDTVYVASPNSLHYDYVKLALEHGKHVICEKPFTSTLKELEELIALSRKKNLFLFEAITGIHLPHFKAVAENLENIGSVKVVQATYSQYSSRYDKLKNGEITNVFNLEFSGGALADLNIYNLHFVMKLFGAPNGISYTANKHENGVDTSGVCVLDYDNFFATCVGSKDTSSENFILIQGEKGFIHVKGAANTMDVVEIHTDSEVETVDLVQNENNMVAEVETFAKIMDEADHEESLRLLNHSLTVMKYFEAARKSAGIFYPADEK
ncbi:Gfo/Idh/MocA family protein [Salinicoccus albus]|uniref:Gfo/Idh/MocA family protein n=1 Tax=Salinicoccus albus TaxID=418756 RepID=UPI000360B17A|nr:Gfo/Idh/MocA family oxidoreductase [Salinicoccus albus]